MSTPRPSRVEGAATRKPPKAHAPGGRAPVALGKVEAPATDEGQKDGAARGNHHRGPSAAPTTGPASQPIAGHPSGQVDQSNSPVTVGHALEKLLQHTAHRVRQGVRSEATLRMQRWHVGFLAEQLGANLPLSAIRYRLVVEMAERWAAGGNLAPHTISKRLSTLRRALRLAVAREELPAMPVFPEVAAPPRTKRHRILNTFDEYRRLMAGLRVHRAEFVATALWTCQRPSDVERMTWGHVDLVGDPPTMRIRSTKTRRPEPIRVKMPTPLVSVLTERHHRLTSAGLAPSPNDPLVDAWPSVSSRLPVVAARLGLPPMSAMDLRHTGISWMVRRTGLTVAAQTWGGWSSFTMMELHYAHALPARLVDAADELASIAEEASAG
jgi:integrase